MTPRRRVTYIVLSLALLCISAGMAYAPIPQPHVIVKGVALLDWSHMEDLTTLNAPAFYGWGEYCGVLANCTNMVRNWTMPASCYLNLLVGNEPTNPEPAGYPITPTLAAQRTVAIETACPHTRLIVANIHVNNTDPAADLQWLTDYYTAYAALTAHPLRHTVGLHCYAYSLGQCEQRLSAAMALSPHVSRYWITETQAPQFYANWQTTWAALLKWYARQSRIERVYAWTNRGADYTSMVNADGTLNQAGITYRDWRARAWFAWLPLNAAGGGGYP